MRPPAIPAIAVAAVWAILSITALPRVALAEGPHPTERVNTFRLLTPAIGTAAPERTGFQPPPVIGRYGCASDRGKGVRDGTVAGMLLGAAAGAIADGKGLEGMVLGGMAGAAVGAIVAPEDPRRRCTDEAVAADVARRTEHFDNPLRGYVAQEPVPLAPKELWDDRLPEKERERRRAQAD